MTRRLALLALLSWIAPLDAAVLDDVRARGVIRIATTFDYRPFSYRVDGEAAGIDVALGRNLAAHLGVTPVWVETSWPTLLADLEAGRFDIAMSGISVTLERAERGHLSRPYFHTGKSVLARCAVAARFHALGDVDRPDVRVIVNLGGTNDAFVTRHIREAQVVRYPDNAGIFDALEGGAADVMITDAVEADVESARHPGLCHEFEPPWLEPIDKVWLMPPDDAWKRRVDEWLQDIEADGSLAAIVERERAKVAAAHADR